MIALIADDDAVSRRLILSLLKGRAHEIHAVSDGLAAWEVLSRADEPVLAVLDWMMPGLEGPELCRRARARPAIAASYILLVTARGAGTDVVAGLEAGADDHVTKPFRRPELLARIRVGERVLDLQAGLRARIAELEEAHSRIHGLEALLAMCAYCKRVRAASGNWDELEEHLASRTGAKVTHGVCPDCLEAISPGR